VIYSGSPAEFLGSYCMQRTECRSVFWRHEVVTWWGNPPVIGQHIALHV